jgi:hypothetical protein
MPVSYDFSGKTAVVKPPILEIIHDFEQVYAAVAGQILL